jgi:ribosome maturation protein Sdo1
MPDVELLFGRSTSHFAQVFRQTVGMNPTQSRNAPTWAIVDALAEAHLTRICHIALKKTSKRLMSNLRPKISREIEHACSNIKVEGTRSPERLEQMSGR